MSTSGTFIAVISEDCAHSVYRSCLMSYERVEVFPLKYSIDSLQEHIPNLIIIDCGNEVRRGLQVLQDVRSLSQDIPVIFLTDLSSEDIVLKAYKLEARAYFKKPVDFFEIKATIEKILNNKEESGKREKHFFEDKIKNTGEFTYLKKSVDTSMPVNVLSSVNYILDNLSDPLCLEEIAKAANLSKFHYCRIFKDVVGHSPIKFITLLRIHKAKELLRRRELTVSTVAFEVGFNELRNFEIQFKQVTGMTPSSYKNTFKPN
jgi:YesN/AraC family two-component response regulator